MSNCNNEEIKNENTMDSTAEETPELSEKLEDEEFEELNEEEEQKKKIEELNCANKDLEDENNKLNNELNALKDRLARTMSEYENYRKRTAKEKEGIYSDACADVLKEMLPVLDNLQRAVAVEGTVEDLRTGIEMTIKQFYSSFEKLNVEEISTEGEFDPNFHNAVMHVEDESLGKNSVAEVFQKGFKRGDKVLRYSMVKVAN